MGALYVGCITFLLTEREREKKGKSNKTRSDCELQAEYYISGVELPSSAFIAGLKLIYSVVTIKENRALNIKCTEITKNPALIYILGSFTCTNKTNNLEHSPSSETNSCSANQNFLPCMETENSLPRPLIDQNGSNDTDVILHTRK